MQAIVKTILDRFLGPYCDFQGDINIDMWSGKAVLRHVRIKPEVIESMGIPLDISSGYIDRIGLVCDWRSGFNKPVEVELSHIYAVVSPRTDYRKLDLEKIRKDAMQAKCDKKIADLKEWEDSQFDQDQGFVGKLGRRLLRIEPRARKQAAEENNEYTSPENMTKLEKLIAKIMANLRIKVSNVHIRLEFEDNAIGVKIREFSVQTTDELFKPGFIKEIKSTLFKAIVLEQLSVYVNSGPSVSSTLETQNLAKNEAPANEPQFRYVLRTEFEQNSKKYLVNPVSFIMHVTMQQQPSEKVPKMKIDAYLDEMKIFLKDSQYRSMLRVNGALSKSSEVLQQLIGPQIYVEGNADSNLVEVDREYCELYRRTLQVPGLDIPSLSKDDEGRMSTLELGHTVEEIKFYRKSVLNELDEYLVRRSGQMKYEILRKKDVSSQHGFSSMFSWFRSGKTEHNIYEGLLPTDSEIDNILETTLVEQDEEKAISTIFSEVSFKLPEISLTLLGEKGDLLHGAIVRSEFKATALDMSRINLELSVSTVSISNLIFQDAAFPELLYSSSQECTGFGGSPLLHLLIRVNPDDLPAKFAVFGGIEPIDIVIDYVLIQNILPFFSMDTNAPVTIATQAPVEDSLNVISSLTSASPKDVALMRRPSIIVDLKISAPTILVPQRPLDKDTILLVIDLGCFFISTNPASGSTTDVDFSSIDASDVNNVDNPLYKRFYDNFTLDYKNLQIFLSKHGKNWRSFYDPESTDSKLLCPVSSSLFLGLCVVVQSGPLATLVVNVCFKPLTVQISPKDLREIMVISTGFQAISQIQMTTSDDNMEVETTRTRPSGSIMSIDQSIPSDLAVRLSGKETDVDMAINVALEKLNLAVSVDSKTVLRASIDGISVGVTRRTFDTAVSFSIHDMYVEECLSRTKLIQSYLPTALIAPEDATVRHFISCRYSQTDRISPSFQEVDHFVELAVGLLELNLEPTSIFETALFMKHLLDAVTLSPELVDSVQSAFDSDYLQKPDLALDSHLASKTSTVISLSSKFDGIMLRILIQKNVLLEASIRRIFCDVKKDAKDCIKASIKLDTILLEDCLTPIDGFFRHILVSAEELPQLLVLDFEYCQSQLNMDCKLDAMTLLFRTVLIQELLDLIQFSPVSRISSVFAQVPSEGVSESNASEAPDTTSPTSELKPGRISVQFGQLQLKLAPDDKMDQLFTLSLKSASAQSQRSEVLVDIREFQAFISASDNVSLAKIMSISSLNVVYDAISGGQQPEQSGFSVQFSSSPLSLLAGTKEYIALIDMYNSYIEVKPVVIREAYSIVETPLSLPPVQSSIAAVLPAMSLVVDKICSKMHSNGNAATSLNLELNGRMQASLQSATGNQGAIMLGSGFSFTMNMNSSNSWGILATLDALDITRQAKDISMNILRQTDLSLEVVSVPLTETKRDLSVNIVADQLHFTLSYSSILLCRNSYSILMQAFNPVLDSLQRKVEEDIEAGDAFDVPAKIEFPTSIGKKESLVAWDLNETFNMSLRSIRVDVTNDVISSSTAKRLPVLELLILIEPNSEGHGYGNVRHMYLGLLLSAKIYNMKVSAWEPFLERTAVAITSRQTVTVHELSIAFAEKFDVNISDRMLASFMDSYKSFSSALTAPTTLKLSESLSVENQEQTKAEYAIEIRNDLEIPVKVFFDVGAESHVVEVDSFSSNKLPFFHEFIKLHLSVSDDFSPIKDISIERVGAQSFWAIGNKSTNKNNSVHIIFEISDTGSSKKLLIHSDRKIENNSPVVVSIAGIDVNPGQSLWLPAFSHDPSSILYLSIHGSNTKSSLDFSQDTSWLTFDVPERGRLVCLQTERRKDMCNSFVIDLKPSRLVQNLLPIPCSFLCTASNLSWKDETPSILSGHHHGLTFDPNQEFNFHFKLPFMESWSSPTLVSGDLSNIVSVQDRNHHKLNINVEVQLNTVIVFVGYWVYDLVQLPDNIQLQIASEQLEPVPSVFPESELSSDSGKLQSLIEPLMFDSESGRAFLRLSLQDSKWSQVFSIQAAGSSEVVTVIAGTEAYQFNVNTSLCMAPFTRTKKVVFTPRYIIVNSLHFPIVYKQDGDSSEYRLGSDESRPVFSWPNCQLPEKLCFKKDDAVAFWTSPISVADITDETVALQGRTWSRLARFEVQRGNSNFLLLSHQKPSLVPLVVLNRTVYCDIWVRQHGHVTWRHLSPGSGYPFEQTDRSHRSLISLKLGRKSAHGSAIYTRLDLNLMDLKDKERVLSSWNNQEAHDLVIELEERGPFLSVIVSERFHCRDAMCTSIASVHSTINELVSQWTSKKVELTELTDDVKSYLYLELIECSHLGIPSEVQAIYLAASVADQTVRTPSLSDINDPYIGFQHVFTLDKGCLDRPLALYLYTTTADGQSNIFCQFDIPIQSDVTFQDKWFDLEVQRGHSLGQIHVVRRVFNSRNELLKFEMQGINAALLKQQDIVRELDSFLDSIPVAMSTPADIVADPTQKIALLEFQILPMEIRGQDIPQLQPIPPDLEAKTVSPTNLAQSSSPIKRRLICEFKTQIVGPDKDSTASVLMTSWKGEQIARLLKESFSFRTLSTTSDAGNASVEIILKEEERQSGQPVQYRIIDTVTLPLHQETEPQIWVRFNGGRHEICLTVIRSEIDVRRRDLFKPITQIQLFCNQIGVSLIDRLSREIMYICLSKTFLNLMDADDQLGLSCSIGSLQSDNQMREALYPVVVFPKGTQRPDKNRLPWLQIAAFNLKDQQNEGFLNLQYFSLLLQETYFFVEEELIWSLYEFANGIGEILNPVASVRQLGLSLSESRVHPDPGSTANIYLRSLTLHPIALNITFQPDLIRREEKRLRLVSRYANPIDMLLGAAGVTLGSIKEAPIRIDSLEISNAFGSWDTLTAPIRTHYLIQLLQQAYKLLGSLSVLGNPVGLVSNLGQGVKHLFYDPAQGLVSSPLDFGRGLATGSRRFVQHTVGGVLSSAGQITSSLSTGVAVLTMDRNYLRKREKDERQRIRNAAQGTESHNVATGLMAFGSGLIGGLRGAVEKPVAGLKKGGALGFLKGIVKGGAGLIAQPIVGVIDLGTHTVQGIQGVIGRPTRLYGASRCRLPRFTTKAGVLDQYDTLSAKAQSVLWASEKLLGKISLPLTTQQRQQETLISCKEIRADPQTRPEEFRTIDFALTSFRLIAAEFESDAQPPSKILFSIGFDQIESVSHSPEDRRLMLWLTDGNAVPIQTQSPSEADEFLQWIVEHLEDCTPIIRQATYGSGNCWITITDLLQNRVAMLGRVPIIGADVVHQMIEQQRNDPVSSAPTRRLWVEYTRGPDLITAEFDLTQPIAF